MPNNPTAYGLGSPQIDLNGYIPATRDPTVNDYANYDVGANWLNTTTQKFWKLAGFTNGQANWTIVSQPTLPLTVANGGTGQTSLTANTVLLGEGTNPIGMTTVGTSGQVLMSQGPGLDPIWGTASSLVGYTSVFNTYLGVGSGSNDFGNQNTGIGKNCLPNPPSSGPPPNSAKVANTAIGDSAMFSSTYGLEHTALGYHAMYASNGGQYCVSVGSQSSISLNAGAGPVSDGNYDTVVGAYSFQNNVTGQYNLILGYQSGNAYASDESNNIIVGASISGVLGESNVIRIGNADATSCYISGISGATPVTGNTPQVTLTDNTGQLSTISSSSKGYVLTSNGTATPSFQAPITLNRQVFTSSGTYTPTAGMLYCDIEIVGGGGGSGGCHSGSPSSYAAASGGGGGGYARKLVSASTIGASQTVTIGAGGTAGASGGGNGGTGGTSSVGSIISATGGTGGLYSTAITSGGYTVVGGYGGTGSGGDFNSTGIPSSPGLIYVGGILYGGSGGSSYLGGGAQVAGGGATAAVAGTSYGSGAAGGAVQFGGAIAGAAGAPGIVIITEYM